jgi:3-oxoacyl-[acyl-carrier protein] reductase
MQPAVIVTGGAGGIGLASARAILAHGVSVVLADLDERRLADCLEALGGDSTVETAVVDVTDGAGLARLAADVDTRRGLHGLVNAAGTLQLGTVHDVTEADWDRVVGINLKGTYLACRAVIPILEKRGGGAIVNLASISGRTKSFYAAPSYVASKAGVIGLTMVLAAQHASMRIRVNCVAPGIIDTPMTSIYTEEHWSSLLGTIPLGRIGEAREVGDVVAELLSDRFSYVTGQCINVNGGQFML